MKLKRDGEMRTQKLCFFCHSVECNGRWKFATRQSWTFHPFEDFSFYVCFFFLLHIVCGQTEIEIPWTIILKRVLERNKIASQASFFFCLCILISAGMIMPYSRWLVSKQLQSIIRFGYVCSQKKTTIW